MELVRGASREIRENIPGNKIPLEYTITQKSFLKQSWELSHQLHGLFNYKLSGSLEIDLCLTIHIDSFWGHCQPNLWKSLPRLGKVKTYPDYHFDWNLTDVLEQ